MPIPPSIWYGEIAYFLSRLSSMSKATAENGHTVSELVIIVSGLLLALGAVGEYLEEHGKFPKWTKWVFISAVVVSLIGEFSGDAGVFVFSEHLQATSDSENEELRKATVATDLK